MNTQPGTHSPRKGVATPRFPKVAARCLAIASSIVAGAASGDGYIREYENQVFTNEGSSSVAEFKEKLGRAAQRLAEIDGLIVYVGYHGDGDGYWCNQDFNDGEKKDVAGMASAFPKATLEWVAGANLPDDDIRKSVTEGKVFFTWCNSDKRVTAVMGQHMPKLKNDFK